MNTGIVTTDRTDEPVFIHSDLDDAGLSPFAFRIYCHLRRRLNKNGLAWPGGATMAKTTRMGRSTVLAAVAELEERGMVVVERHAKGSLESNHYHLMARKNWTPAPEHVAPKARGGRKACLPGKQEPHVCPTNTVGLPGKHEGNPISPSNIDGEISKTSVQESKGTPLALPPPSPKPEKPQYPIGCNPAAEIELDITAPDEVKRAWAAWQNYRTERHNTKGPRKLGWTAAAAKLAAEQLNRAALTMTEADIFEKVRQAILSDWKTFYLNPTPHHGTAHQHGGGARKFAAVDSAPPQQYETDLTGEIRP